MRELSSSFLIISRPREIHEDAAHQASRQRVKMGTILPVDVLSVYKAKVNLVNKGGRLEGVARLFCGHIPLGKPMQLAIHKWHEFLECLFVP